jgi:4-hydroxymandelate synthase
VSFPARPFDDASVDHLGFYVRDLTAAAGWLTKGFGLEVVAATDPAGTAGARSAALGSGRIRLVLTEPLDRDHPGARYLAAHGDGVADVALRVPDAAAAYEEAVRRGATAVRPPAVHGDVVTATVLGFGDVAHTFVQRDTDAPLPGLVPAATPPAEPGPGGLWDVDHLAVCVQPGHIDGTVEFYRRVLDFELIFTEHIVIGTQAMTTKVVQSRSGAVTFTLIEPDVTQNPGHIEEFLTDHGGAGVQHIAFSTDDIVTAVDGIGRRGVEFLPTPETYYAQLPGRIDVGRHPVEELSRLDVLVDQDHDGQLFQIFTKSVHPRGTIFYEVIERLGARSFGSGNIAALYRAVEAQRDSDDESVDDSADAA